MEAIMIDMEQVRKKVDLTIVEGDPMYNGNIEHYASVGESALRNIIAALLSASRDSQPGSVLDFACANGRVTRWLRAAFPKADLHVADIIPEWVESSAKIYNATGWASTTEFIDIEPPRKFDLIWCGSLATHISQERSANLIKMFREWLNPGGVAVLTMHGRMFTHYAITEHLKYFDDNKYVKPLLANLAFRNFGYQPHAGQDQGISAATPAWLIEQVMSCNARLVSYCEYGWDNHQDVIAFQRAEVVETFFKF